MCGTGGEFASVRAHCEGALLVTFPTRHYIVSRGRIAGHPHQHFDRETTIIRHGAVNLGGHGGVVTMAIWAVNMSVAGADPDSR